LFTIRFDLCGYMAWKLMLMFESSCSLLVAIRGCRIRPFLSQMVEVCCLRCILFGILIDSMLSWNLHICNMISRVKKSKFASIIRFGSLPPAVLYVLYSAFVMPLFDYCDVIWTPIYGKADLYD